MWAAGEDSAGALEGISSDLLQPLAAFPASVHAGAQCALGQVHPECPL